MPSTKFIVKSKYNETFRTSKVTSMFDVPVENEIVKEWDVNIPVEDINWNIGVIVGASGSGKTTIGKEIFGKKNYHKDFKWSARKSLLDDFDANVEVKDIVESLSKVGFSSPPSWLLPFDKLSNGQKFRVEIARCIMENDLTVFDEFTSVVDRQVAKIGCAAVQKFIRKKDKQFVALSCHYDILEWLEPDWIYDVSSGEFTRGSLRRPKIKAEVYECDRKAWALFKDHHYLSSNLANHSKAFVMFIEGVPIGFSAAISFPNKAIKNTWREHRTVILPDYQGVGLGSRLSDEVASIMMKKVNKYYSTTGHPAMINYRKRSDKWRMIRKIGFINKQVNKSNRSSASNRLTASFEYIGD